MNVHTNNKNILKYQINLIELFYSIINKIYCQFSNYYVMQSTIPSNVDALHIKANGVHIKAIILNINKSQIN